MRSMLINFFLVCNSLGGISINLLIAKDSLLSPSEQPALGMSVLASNLPGFLKAQTTKISRANSMRMKLQSMKTISEIHECSKQLGLYHLKSIRDAGRERIVLSLRGGYTPKHGKKSKSKRKPLSLKYKIQKRIRSVNFSISVSHYDAYCSALRAKPLRKNVGTFAYSDWVTRVEFFRAWMACFVICHVVSAPSENPPHQEEGGEGEEGKTT